MSVKITPRTALILFVALVAFALGQAVWWIVFMAQLTDEKVELAESLGGDPSFVEAVHQEEIRRQIMVGAEGVFFLVLILVGAWLIYRALVKTEELKFHHDNFMMSVTHELRTPLASLRLYLDTLESEKISPEKKLGVVPRMRDDIGRLERIVDNILQAGRFERDEAHMTFDRFDFSALVKKRLEKLGRIPSSIPREINADIQSGIAVEGDEDSLRRAVDTVLENGLKYTACEKVSLEVNLASERGKVMLMISDNGVGLSRKECASVFDRFYRVDNEISRCTPGSGLGLYLCREIVKRHDGSITARSDGPGKGSVFEIQLKAAE